MNWLRELARRLTMLVHRGKFDADLEEEMRLHLELRAQEQLASGLTAEEARAAAMRQFGNVTYLGEESRVAWGWKWFEQLAQDASYGLRILRKSWGFTAVAVLTLAIGIGANTAIFSVIEGVMFRPLPFSGANELVHIQSVKNGHKIGPSPADLRDFEQSNRTFQDMAVYDTWRKNVSFSGVEAAPEQMVVGLVPGAYFRVLGIKPVMGRLFTDEQNDARKNYVAVISEAVWKTRYSGDPAVLGRKMRINDEPYTIVAVIPDAIPAWMEGASIGGSVVQVWTPFAFADSLGDLWTEAGRAGRGWYSLGRLKPGVSLEQAQADLATIAARLAKEHPVDQGFSVTVERLSETRIGGLRPMLFLLMGAVSLILLIACVNLAHLLLARNFARERELAVRAALGAGRGRLVRQLACETLMLALIGGGVGLVLAKVGIESLKTVRPDNLTQLASVRVDWRVLAFALMVSLITGLLFGLGPAVTASRMNLVENLKTGSRSGATGSNGQRVRNALVMAEMAMSLMLIVSAGLLVQSVIRLQGQALGIRVPEHLLKGHFYLPPARYPDPGALTRSSDQFADHVRALPGVQEASITTIWPPNYNWRQMLEIPGRVIRRVQDIPIAEFGLTDAYFLRTMGIPLMQGRDFNESDSATSSPVALINQELARRYFPNEDPIGQLVHIGPPQFMNIRPGANTTDSADVTIVGIIGDFRNNGLASPPEPQIIALYSQHPHVNYGFKDIVVRTASDPHALTPEIAQQLHDMDAELPFAQVQTISEVVEQDTGNQRFTTGLLGLFAGIGLMLAAVGIYGVVSFLAAQHQRELAVRIAVGASFAGVLWLVLKDGLRMGLIGALAGLAGAWTAQKLMAHLLFGISPVDPPTFAGAALFLTIVAVAACWMPAWRAARIDPCIALRAE
jgi:predicted permease